MPNKNAKPKYRSGPPPSMAKVVRTAIKQLKPFETGGTMLGGAIGTRVGMPNAGRLVGKGIGKFLGQVTGLGDYTVRQNAITTIGGHTADVPTFSRENDSIVVTHREYIGDVVSSSVSGGFKITTYAVNPSDGTVFPWLSQLSSMYDQWEPLGIVFDYKSTSSIYNAVNQQLGTVIVASQYDAYDPVFTNKIDMENSQFAVSCRTDEHILHPIECDPSQRGVKIYYVGDTRGIDRRLNTFVTVSVATTGITGTNIVLGELWVTYKIKLYKPLIFRPLAGNWTTTTINPNSAAAFWGTMVPATTTLNNYATNLTGVAFSSTVAGTGVLTFNDPSTWGRTYLCIANAAISIGANNYTMFWSLGTGSQATAVSGLDLRTVATQMGAIVGEVTCITAFKMRRDNALNVAPYIQLTFTYTAADIIQSLYLQMYELADFGL